MVSVCASPTCIIHGCQVGCGAKATPEVVEDDLYGAVFNVTTSGGRVTLFVARGTTKPSESFVVSPATAQRLARLLIDASALTEGGQTHRGRPSNVFDRIRKSLRGEP